MKLDDEAKKAVEILGNSINSAVGESRKVAEAIEHLRSIGYEPHLTLRLEIALEKQGAGGGEIDFSPDEDEEIPAENTEIELELTEEDLRTLQRMKIKF
jgi:hypothetical protein